MGFTSACQQPELGAKAPGSFWGCCGYRILSPFAGHSARHFACAASSKPQRSLCGRYCQEPHSSASKLRLSKVRSLSKGTLSWQSSFKPAPLASKAHFADEGTKARGGQGRLASECQSCWALRLGPLISVCELVWERNTALCSLILNRNLAFPSSVNVSSTPHLDEQTGLCSPKLQVFPCPL